VRGFDLCGGFIIRVSPDLEPKREVRRRLQLRGEVEFQLGRSSGQRHEYIREASSERGRLHVIDDWLFTVWSHSDYEVKITITHTETPNYGFPVSLMGMQLFIANVSGSVLVNSYIDRANLEASLRAFIPACDVSPPLDSNMDNGREVNAR